MTQQVEIKKASELLSDDELNGVAGGASGAIPNGNDALGGYWAKWPAGNYIWPRFENFVKFEVQRFGHARK